MSSVIVPQEMSMIVSSDPTAGAINRDTLGSYFEVPLTDGGLEIPKNAQNVTVSVEESTIWWVIPNIITGVNDKFYITGNHKGSTQSGTELGYNMTQVNLNQTANPSAITLTATIGIDDPMPVGQFKVGDFIRYDNGPLSGFSYEIIQILGESSTIQSFIIANTPDILTNGIYSFSRVRPANVIQDTFIITIPKGLYDLGGLNQAILRELENEGAQNDPNPLIVLTADEPTQKVEIRFNYDNVSVDFTQPNTPREILGFQSAVYGPYATAPENVLAPDIAQFNQVNYFLLHSDLVNKGIRFNNNYTQTISQVLIDVPPGSQIVSTPFNPAKTNANELKGVKRTLLRFWITDEKNNRIDTNGEYWSARIVIKYQMTLVLEKN